MRSEKSRRAALDRFMNNYHSMKVLKVEYPWFVSMMEAIIVSRRGKYRVGNAKAQNKLCLLEIADGRALGSHYHHLLQRCATEEGAFDSWIAKHKALGEFSKLHPFFRPLVTR